MNDLKKNLAEIPASCLELPSLNEDPKNEKFHVEDMNTLKADATELPDSLSGLSSLSENIEHVFDHVVDLANRLAAIKAEGEKRQHDIKMKEIRFQQELKIKANAKVAKQLIGGMGDFIKTNFGTPKAAAYSISVLGLGVTCIYMVREVCLKRAINLKVRDVEIAKHLLRVKKAISKGCEVHGETLSVPRYLQQNTFSRSKIYFKIF